MSDLREPPTSSQQRTQELLEEACGGSEAAWARLFARHRKFLLLVVRSLQPPVSRRRFDAEDVLQAGFLAAWRRIDSFEYRGEGSLRFWLKSIVKHELSNEMRYHRRQRRQVSPESGVISDSSRLIDMEDERAVEPSESAARNEEEELLLDAMSELSERDRDVLIMRMFERMSWPRIAEYLESSEPSCRRWFEEAMDRLQRRMKR